MPPPRRHLGYGSGTTIWLLRHAEVDQRWRGRAYGDLDVQLSAEGRETTRALAAAFAELALDGILSSPLERALELGRGIADTKGAPLEIADGLREIRRGDWQGRKVQDLYEEAPEQVAAFYADPWGYRGHGGECDEDVLARAWPVFEAAVQAHSGGTVCFATHYNVIRVVAAHLLGIEPARSFGFRVDPGRCVQFLDRAPDTAGAAGWVLLRSNVADPTPEEARA